jgi:hypothetical protein
LNTYPREIFPYLIGACALERPLDLRREHFRFHLKAVGYAIVRQHPAYPPYVEPARLGKEREGLRREHPS